MAGTGYTVSKGEVPEAFSAEVLGVLPDGVGPGRDMIIVEANSPAIDDAGGIWFGMSGSPVYVGGQLIGAVAFGLSFGPSNIAGLTAAKDLVALADRPAVTPQTTPRRVELSPRMVRAIARATDTSVAQTGATMKLLKSPLSVSGIGSHRLDVVNQAIRNEKLALFPYAGSSAAAALPPPAASAPEPGGNFAAAATYGDVTLAGIGTTSYVCNGKAVAFGHSFFGLPAGDIALGANLADAITVVDDPVFGAFKLATLSGTLGLLDQDRFAGVRTILGGTFPLTPITSTVTTEDGLSTRDGETDVVEEDFVPFGAFIHMLGNIDFTRDEISAGSSALSWTVNGTREGGAPWSLSRSNMYVSDFDISIESIFELEQQLFTLLSNRFEDITFNDVDVDANVGEVVRRYQLTSLQVKKRGQYVESARVRAFPGKVLSLRAVLTPEGSDVDKIVDFTMQVPPNARRDHFISVGGGGSTGGGFFVDEEACFSTLCRTGNHVPKADSFDELLAILEGSPQNNDLTAVLRGARGKRKAVFTAEQDQVVTGEAFLYIRIFGGSGGVETVTAKG
jgi:hypothetical protein